ncbi:hypothetical protein HOLleu_13340 [Holothuria leucospilota]|uniref:Uncharacterized protein n=1 Tax=Holothuria leucospilota TaxID=206669 RepID=A0A9Q1CBP8_HOLLE|nr:hypothetical protein HOLleu_13340 [Holothuria leucospilota]
MKKIRAEKCFKCEKFWQQQFNLTLKLNKFYVRPESQFTALSTRRTRLLCYNLDKNPLS